MNIAIEKWQEKNHIYIPTILFTPKQFYKFNLWLFLKYKTKKLNLMILKSI